MNKKSEMKIVEWVGYVSGKPHWENTSDDYPGDFKGTDLFKTKKDARKRFEDVRPVMLFYK